MTGRRRPIISFVGYAPTTTTTMMSCSIHHPRLDTNCRHVISPDERILFMNVRRVSETRDKPSSPHCANVSLAVSFDMSTTWTRFTYQTLAASDSFSLSTGTVNFDSRQMSAYIYSLSSINSALMSSALRCVALHLCYRCYGHLIYAFNCLLMLPRLTISLFQKFAAV